MTPRLARALPAGLLLLGVLAPPAAAVAPSSWRAEIEGGVVRTSSYDDGAQEPEVHVALQSRETYRAKLSVTFAVRADGRVTGGGTGEYTVAAWHIEGVNGAAGAIACDPPVAAAPFGVEVGGTATDDRIVLDVRVDAREVNADFDCGGDYTGFAAEATYLAESWAAVGGRSLGFHVAAPSLPVLRRDDRTDEEGSVGLAASEWRVALTRVGDTATPGPRPAPGPGPSIAPGADPGATPGRRQVPPTAAQCTIVGTPGADALVGTPERDVICGLAGDDRIVGLDGNDVIAGGPGRDVIVAGRGADRVFGGRDDDVIAAGDGRRDIVIGGGGRDHVWMDVRLDRVLGIELRTPIARARPRIVRPDPAPPPPALPPFLRRPPG